MAEFWLKRFGMAFHPYEEEGAQLITEIPQNVPTHHEVYVQPNEELRRFYWSLVGRLARGMGRDKEDFDYELRVKAGHCRRYLLTEGGEVAVPKSLKREECDGAEFSRYIDNVVPVLYSIFDPKLIDEMMKKRPR
jgi:hypothetical protein